MFAASVTLWCLAMAIFVYDAGGHAVARRIGPLRYRVQIQALATWKTWISAVTPPGGFLALMASAFWAYGFWGLVAFVMVWFLGSGYSTRVFMQGANYGTIEIDDFVPTRWLHLTIGGLATTAMAVALYLAG